MKNYNIVIDTNVLVSAFKSNKLDVATVKVVNLIFEKNVKAIFDMNVIKEYVDVLYRKELGLDERLLDDIIIHIIKNGKEMSAEKSDIRMIDESDRKFYDLYKTNQTFYFVTGNLKHYPKEKNIILPRQFIDIYDSNNE